MHGIGCGAKDIVRSCLAFFKMIFYSTQGLFLSELMSNVTQR
jgi:hypothetical protein